MREGEDELHSIIPDALQRWRDSVPAERYSCLLRQREGDRKAHSAEVVEGFRPRRAVLLPPLLKGMGEGVRKRTPDALQRWGDSVPVPVPIAWIPRLFLSSLRGIHPRGNPVSVPAARIPCRIPSPPLASLVRGRGTTRRTAPKWWRDSVPVPATRTVPIA